MQDLLNPAITREVLDRRQSKEAQLQMQRRLNPPAYWPRTEDKLEFDRYCRNAGLPVPRNFGSFVVSGSDVGKRAAHRAAASAVLASATAPHLIVKPIDGVYGLGVARLAVDDDTFVCHDGRRRTAEAVYDWIAQNSPFTRYLVQERVWPHAELIRLSGTESLQTVRMVTYVATDGAVAIGNCQLRVIVGDSPTDNYHGGRTGNLICDIPSAGGVVSRGFGPADGGRRFMTVERHPGTGVAFAGFQVPCWAAACRLVRDAAAAFRPLRTIGWDVAITDGEPLLIEGNITWDPAYEGPVGGEILAAVRADRAWQPTSTRLRPVAAK